MKKEYEIVIEIMNACAGSGRPEVNMEEAELENPDDFVKMKHGRDWDKVQKTILPSGEIQYILSSERITYKYIFSE
jgi:hypothetical protein